MRAEVRRAHDRDSFRTRVGGHHEAQVACLLSGGFISIVQEHESHDIPVTPNVSSVSLRTPRFDYH